MPSMGRPAGTTPLADFGQDVFTRVDELNESNPSLFGTLARDEIAGLTTGTFHNGIGLAQGIGNVLEGVRTGSPGQIGAGAVQFGSALVPRFGRFAGPGFGRKDLSPFSTPIGIFSQIHDQGFARAARDPNFARTQANRQLANSLRRSFGSLRGNALGPSAQVFRAGEFLVFEALATGGEALGFNNP